MYATAHFLFLQSKRTNLWKYFYEAGNEFGIPKDHKWILIMVPQRKNPMYDMLHFKGNMWKILSLHFFHYLLKHIFTLYPNPDRVWGGHNPRGTWKHCETTNIRCLDWRCRECVTSDSTSEHPTASEILCCEEAPAIVSLHLRNSSVDVSPKYLVCSSREARPKGSFGRQIQWAAH